jgi:DNA-binding transcriptional MerR regulator
VVFVEKQYLTTGQIAKNLRISISTLKRWLSAEGALENSARNVNGWRLFSLDDLEKLREYKREKKRNGKQFNAHILTPVS